MLSYVSALLTQILSFSPKIAFIEKGRKRRKYKKRFKRPFKGQKGG